MVKWTKVNNEEEHKALINVWGDNVDSIAKHKEWNRNYPYWYSNDNERQSDDGFIERNYSESIVPLQEIIGTLRVEIIIW